jgi:hypothetical protein
MNSSHVFIWINTLTTLRILSKSSKPYTFYDYIYVEKKGCYITSLATHCIYTPWVLMDKLHELKSCNSLYILCNTLQFYQNNSFSTIMQLFYNCTHDVMMMWLIVIHLLKPNMWHYDFFWHRNYFFKILISIIHYYC